MRLTKKLINEGIEIVRQHGYWSEEIYNFNNSIVGKLAMEKYEKLQGILRSVK